MQKLRRQIYHWLEPEGETSNLSRFIDFVLIMLIVVNVFAVILESVDSIEIRHRSLFFWIEVVSVAIFSVEYIARIWVCVENPKFKNAKNPRRSYIFSPVALIDLLAILPFYLGYFVKFDLRFLRVLRLLRILKLTHYSSALAMLINVLREESSAFVAGFFILMVMLVLAASGAYLVEHEMQPEKFGSIPEAMWWAVATLTTVGYGDVTPITPAGKVFGSLVAIVGIGMAALPAGILASGMADHMRRTREELTQRYRAALKDGFLGQIEEARLEKIRREFGLSKRVAGEIRDQMIKELEPNVAFTCPHCGKPFHA